jgi:tripartite-type tricarboxylate transporter receptor subunit TctC
MGRRSLKGILFAVLVILSSHAMAQTVALAQETFPNRPVTIWVGYAAGGVTDMIARTLAEASEKSLGQKVIVVNKTGGAGVVAVSLLVKQKPDGYTLGGYLDTPITRAPHLRDLDYDPFKDLTHIIRACLFKSVFVVKADSLFKKWEDLVEWARKNPGQLTYGEVGPGSVPHITMAKIALKEGFTYKGVTFAGDTPNISAVMGGHVMVANVSALACKGHVQANTLRALLVHEREGLAYAPQVPTFEKIKYDFETPNAFIISAPKGISSATRERLANAFLAGIKTSTFKKFVDDNELLVREPLTGDVLTDYLQKSSHSYEALIKEAGVYKIDRK